MKKIITCLMAAMGLTSACGHQNYENTDVDGFAALTAEPDVVLLDVRTAEEFAEGHIEGAVNIDQSQGDFLVKAKATLPTDKKIAVYCRSGRRSASAAERLAAEGYKVVNLKGGIMAWQAAGMPVTTTASSSPLTDCASTLQATPRTSLRCRTSRTAASTCASVIMNNVEVWYCPVAAVNIHGKFR